MQISISVLFFCFLRSFFLPLSQWRFVEAALAIITASFDSILGENSGVSSRYTAWRPIRSDTGVRGLVI